MPPRHWQTGLRPRLLFVEISDGERGLERALQDACPGSGWYIRGDRLCCAPAMQEVSGANNRRRQLLAATSCAIRPETERRQAILMLDSESPLTTRQA